jgi:threonine synthase
VEPASAASVGGLLRLRAEDRLVAGQRVVCTVTGHGLKDTGWVVDAMPEPIPIPPDPTAAAGALGLVTA